MRTARFLVLTALVMMFQSNAPALDASASISASTVPQAESSWDGKTIEYPAGKAEVTGMMIEIAPGGETGWHLHPVPSFAMVLEGELEVQLKNGAVKNLKAGEALAEVVDALHNGRNVGAAPVKLVVFYTGAVGQRLSIGEDSQQK